MLERIKNLLKDKIIIIAILITICVLGLSLMKMPDAAGIKVANIDKLYHSFAYFVLASTWLFSFYKTPSRKYVIVICCIIFGIIIEVLQNTLTVYRTGDFFDVLANSLGVLVALIIFNLFLSKKQIN